MELKRSSYYRCSYYILIFLISHLWSGIDSELVSGYSINAPQKVTVQQGLCVYIPCRFTVTETETLATGAVGIWINTHEVNVANNSKRNNQFFSNGRFFLVGDVWRGDCSLYIEDPLHEDEGRYRFRVEDKIQFSYRDIQPHVEVTDLTDKPEISPIKSWLDGEEVTLTCTAPGRCKRMNPQITWKGNIQNTRGENRTSNHENGTKTHSSTITFTARKEQNNSTLSCIVWLREGLTAAQQITINIEYPPGPPEIKYSIISKEPSILSTSNCTMDDNNTIYILEESQLSLTCSADSVPQSSLAWKSSNENQTLSSIDKLTFANLSLNDEGFYTCQATNAHGTRETSVTIRITYPPRSPEIKCSIISKESSNCTMDANNTIYILEGSQLSLTCSADSVPESSLVWKPSKQAQISSSIDKLTFTNLSLSDEGFYTCQATNVHGIRETSVTIRITFQPKSKGFLAAAIYGGCPAAVLLVIGVLLITLCTKRKMMQKKENSRQTDVGVADPIYTNLLSNDPHEVGHTPQDDHWPPPEAESVPLNCQEVQYISLDFSRLKPKVSTKDEDDVEEVEYAVVKRIN